MGSLCKPAIESNSGPDAEPIDGSQLTPPPLSTPIETLIAAQELTNNRAAAVPGLILLDLRAKIIYADVEAVRVLTFSQRIKPPTDWSKLLPSAFQPLMTHTYLRQVAFISGRRSYVCRRFVLDHGPGYRMLVRTCMLLERAPNGQSRLSESLAQFHLTNREQQTVRFLMSGLTNKEIAERMNVSPNTVNTFLRSIRSKLSVSTRTGIIAKVTG